jgi:ribosome-binding factor A
MAQPRRILRLQELILRTVATHVQRELRDPRIGMISITRVKLSPDLTQCRVYWSCFGDENTRRTTERGLEDAIGSIQRAVAGSMHTRVTPRLTLDYDEGLAKAQRMEEIFQKLREERGDPEPPPDEP